MFNNSSTAFTMPVIPANYGYSNSGIGGFGGFGSDWIGLIIILALLGWGGNGFGFGGLGGGNGYSEVQRGFDQNAVINKLDGLTYGLSDSTYALNNAINTGFNGVQQTLCQGFNGVNTAILQSANGAERGFANLSSQLAMCCCDIERGIDGVNYNMAKNTCDLQNTMHNNTRDIIDNQNCNTRSILDFLVQDKIATLQAENQNLKLKASQAEQNNFIAANQQAQTAELLRRLAPTPTPAYVVPNPNCCYNAQVSFANGCGCGSF